MKPGPPYRTGDRVEAILGFCWYPARITRGPFRPVADEPEVWEIEINDPREQPYITARNVNQLRPAIPRRDDK